jgi:hypothetical protein
LEAGRKLVLRTIHHHQQQPRLHRRLLGPAATLESLKQSITNDDSIQLFVVSATDDFIDYFEPTDLAESPKYTT